jgi:DNA-binding IscR family transcriptional regulator
MRGGYMLAKKPNEVQVAQVFCVIEDEKPTIAECYSENTECCSIYSACTIRKPLGRIQQNLNALLENTTLEQIV